MVAPAVAARRELVARAPVGVLVGLIFFGPGQALARAVGRRRRPCVPESRGLGGGRGRGARELGAPAGREVLEGLSPKAEPAAPLGPARARDHAVGEDPARHRQAQRQGRQKVALG